MPHTREFVFASAAAVAGLSVTLAAYSPYSPPSPVVSHALPVAAVRPHQADPGISPSVRLDTFTNWESPHVHPLDITPDGHFLLACNTADNRLEVFEVTDSINLIASVPVGLDPVSVRARDNNEAWVVNRVSDDVSIVNLLTMNVRATIKTLDEPGDVVFAGSQHRAFVSCQQNSTVLVFDADVLPAPFFAPIARIVLQGQDPRAMAVSPGGDRLYVAHFMSGNRTTIINGSSDLDPAFIPKGVDSPFSPYFNAANPFIPGVNPPNPPPNFGTAISPQPNPGNSPLTLPVSLIVKEGPDGKWFDDNNHNWTSVVSGANAAASGRPVGWKLLDHDIAEIDPDALTVVNYADHMMHVVAGIAVNPATGGVAAVGSDGINHVRYERNLNGIFTRVKIGLADGGLSQSTVSTRDLNPHLTYTTPSAPLDVRLQSIGDARCIIWAPQGDVGFVSGMGSDNIIVIDAVGNRAADLAGAGGVQPPIAVGRGPTGLALSPDGSRLYVLNRFDGSISTVDVSSRTVLGTTAFFDPTPTEILEGRAVLFDTHFSSGLGQASCASCHVDARTDRLAWDLGSPANPINTIAFLQQNLGGNMVGLAPFSSSGAPFEPFHEMKGPMVTQTFQDIIGHEPFHWRGDRDGIEKFNPTFTNLMGRPAEITTEEMKRFKAYLATITIPPNPFRTFDNRLPSALNLSGHFATGRFAGIGGLVAGEPLPAGDANRGLDLFINRPNICVGSFSCVQCHTLPTGLGTDSRVSQFFLGFEPFPLGPNEAHHAMLTSLDRSTNVSIKVPQLRNMYQKGGCNFTQLENTAGFGFGHDGTMDSLERFVGSLQFQVNNDSEIANLTAFMLAFSGGDLPLSDGTNLAVPPGLRGKDTHAAVGWQVTITALDQLQPGQLDLLFRMTALADSRRVGLVAKTVRDGSQRGFEYLGAQQFKTDHADDITSLPEILNGAQIGSEVTFTVVVAGTQHRIGIDRDDDGCLDFDEQFGCCTGPLGDADFNQDGGIDGSDVQAFFAAWEAAACLADFNADGGVDGADVQAFFFAWENGGG